MKATAFFSKTQTITTDNLGITLDRVFNPVSLYLIQASGVSFHLPLASAYEGLELKFFVYSGDAIVIVSDKMFYKSGSAMTFVGSGAPLAMGYRSDCLALGSLQLVIIKAMTVKYGNTMYKAWVVLQGSVSTVSTGDVPIPTLS